MSTVGPRTKRTPSRRADPRDIQAFAQGIRRIVLEQSMRAGVGHIGSALSIADIVAAVYGDVLDATDPHDPDRDRFVLSKGHASLAVYAALYLRDWLSHEQLSTYCADGTRLGTHPEPGVPGIDFATGSLGHGLSLATGAALAARLDGSKRRAFCLLSDAECNEGSVWEAVMFAAHHRLSNLVAIVDLNGQQALGYTKDVLDLSPMAERWRAFGWDAHEVDGHDPVALCNTIRDLDVEAGPPHVLVAHTVFGKGVSFMERSIEWHYLPMTDGAVRACDAGGGGGVRATFVRTLVELAEEDERIVLLTGDLGFTVVEPFAERFPDRFFNVGVAEQNMVGVATGLAEAGLRPLRLLDRDVRHARSYEFIRNGPVLHRLPVRIVGVGGGLEYGMNGLTHYALEDIAVMRAQPGMTVLAPADHEQARAALMREPRRAGTRLLQARQERDPDCARARRSASSSAGSSRSVPVGTWRSSQSARSRTRRSPRSTSSRRAAGMLGSWSPRA